MNHVAFMGCTAPLRVNPDGSQDSVVDYSSFLWYTGILWAFYGVSIFLSPFGLFPIGGNMKYTWSRFEAGMKESVEGRGDYSNPFVATMTRFAGIGMFTIGLFHIWAADDHPKFDFFTVMTISSGIIFLVFVFDIILGGKFKMKMLAGWAINFGAILALSITVLAYQKGDEKQLIKEKANDGFEAGGPLFYFAVFNTLGSINVWMISYERFAWMGPNLYLKEENQISELNSFTRSIIRLNAMPQVMLSVILWWATLNYEVSPENYGQDFPFLMAIWISYIIFFIWCICNFIANPDDWEPFAIFQAPLLVGSAFAVYITLWHISCYA